MHRISRQRPREPAARGTGGRLCTDPDSSGRHPAALHPVKAQRSFALRSRGEVARSGAAHELPGVLHEREPAGLASGGRADQISATDAREISSRQEALPRLVGCCLTGAGVWERLIAEEMAGLGRPRVVLPHTSRLWQEGKAATDLPVVIAALWRVTLPLSAAR